MVSCERSRVNAWFLGFAMASSVSGASYAADWASRPPPFAAGEYQESPGVAERLKAASSGPLPRIDLVCRLPLAGCHYKRRNRGRDGALGTAVPAWPKNFGSCRHGVYCVSGTGIGAAR
jgi:hypothetical protein